MSTDNIPYLCYVYGVTDVATYALWIPYSMFEKIYYYKVYDMHGNMCKHV